MVKEQVSYREVSFVTIDGKVSIKQAARVEETRNETKQKQEWKLYSSPQLAKPAIFANTPPSQSTLDRP